MVQAFAIPARQWQSSDGWGDYDSIVCDQQIAKEILANMKLGEAQKILYEQLVETLKDKNLDNINYEEYDDYIYLVRLYIEITSNALESRGDPYNVLAGFTKFEVLRRCIETYWGGLEHHVLTIEQAKLRIATLIGAVLTTPETIRLRWRHTLTIYYKNIIRVEWNFQNQDLKIYNQQVNVFSNLLNGGWHSELYSTFFKGF